MIESQTFNILITFSPIAARPCFNVLLKFSTFLFSHINKIDKKQPMHKYFSGQFHNHNIYIHTLSTNSINVILSLMNFEKKYLFILTYNIYNNNFILIKL